MLCKSFKFDSFNTFEKQPVKKRHGWVGLIVPCYDQEKKNYDKKQNITTTVLYD